MATAEAAEAIGKQNLQLTEDGSFQLRPGDFNSESNHHLHPAQHAGGRSEHDQGSPDAALVVADEYLWSVDDFELPVRIRFKFRFLTPGELLPCFSENRVPFGGQRPDALSWYCATHRDDFTFRTGMFNGFPVAVRRQPLRCEVGREYMMDCFLTINPRTGYLDAGYFVDGNCIAQARERAPNERGRMSDRMPSFHRGSFGVAVYSGDEHKVLTDITVQNSESLLHTLTALCKKRHYGMAAELLQGLHPGLDTGMGDGFADVIWPCFEVRSVNFFHSMSAIVATRSILVD